MKLFDTRNPPRLDARPRPGAAAAHEIPAPPSAGARDDARRTVARGVLLLWHDHWDAAHKIAQADEGARDHDLLHAIAHRREGDFGNSGYWFRGAGDHPCFAAIPARLEPLMAQDPALREKILPGGKWDPHGFLAAVRLDRLGDRRAKGGGDPLLRAIQAEEMIAFHEWLAR